MNANDLIEKWENETGSRATDEGSMAQASIMGELARLMGKSKHDPRDDFIVGVLIANSDKVAERENAKRATAELFLASPGINAADD